MTHDLHKRHSYLITLFLIKFLKIYKGIFTSDFRFYTSHLDGVIITNFYD